MLSEITSKLTAYKIPYNIIEHRAVFTVAESAHILPEKVPVKNLLLTEEKGEKLVLVVMKGDERLNIKKLALALGTRKLQFASADLLLQTLGVLPGSVSLFSMLTQNAKSVRLVLDERLRNAELLGFHPNDNTKTIFISARSVEQLLSNEEIKFEYLNI